MKKAAVIPSKPDPVKVAPPVAKKPIPAKVVTPKIVEVKPVKVTEPIETTVTLADLKASLNDIPASLRTQELWKAQMEAHVLVRGYETAIACDPYYFNAWIKG